MHNNNTNAELNRFPPQCTFTYTLLVRFVSRFFSCLFLVQSNLNQPVLVSSFVRVFVRALSLFLFLSKFIFDFFFFSLLLLFLLLLLLYSFLTRLEFCEQLLCLFCKCCFLLLLCIPTLTSSLSLFSVLFFAVARFCFARDFSSVDSTF